MGLKKATKKRGRPNKNENFLNEESILFASENLLKTENISGFSMRKLAKLLNVNSMAIYYYFPDKINLVSALLNQRFENYITRIQKFLKRKIELETVCISYLKFYQNSREIIHFLSLVESEIFEIKELSVILFKTSLLSGMNHKIQMVARNVIVDFIHGYALGGKKNYKKKEFLAELGIIAKGIEMTKIQNQNRVIKKVLHADNST